jgi:hypothetical protein
MQPTGIIYLVMETLLSDIKRLMTEKLKFTIQVLTLIYGLCINSFAQTTVTGPTSGIWTKANSPYILSGQVYIPVGQSLTVQAGVEIRSMTYSDYISVYGTLTAIGSSADSIRFKGFAVPDNTYSTHGGTLRFESGSINSQLQYVSMDRWGDVNYSGDIGAIYISTAGVSITKSTIKNSESIGIKIENIAISPTIQDNSFVNNPSSIATFISGASNISLNRSAAILLLNGTSSQNGILQKQSTNSYFKLDNNASSGPITIAQGHTIEIKPGVEIRSLSYSDYISVYGSLIAKGTAADSIRFKGYASANSSSSTHGGILRFESGSINSELEYVSMDRWGDNNYQGDYGAIYINTSGVSITKSTIKNSENYGIKIENTAISPNIQNNGFVNNPISIGAYLSNSTNISMNRGASILLMNGITTQNGTLQKQSTLSYFTLDNNFSSGQITIAQGHTIDIKPGVEIRSTHYNDIITINGTLLARGTSADSIKFRGFANPNTSNSSHGGSLMFGPTSTNSQLEYISMDSWGDVHYNGEYYGAIYINTSGVSITKSTIKNSENFGIRIENTAISPTIQDNTFVNNPNAIGTYMSGCSNISLNRNANILLLNGSSTQNTTLQKQSTNSYFRLDNNYSSGPMTIAQGHTLEIKPGVEIRSANYNSNITINGTLIAKGVAADSIRFRGFPDPNYVYSTHGGSLIFNTGSTGSQLEYVSIDRWGDSNNGDYGAVYINTTGVSITKSVIRNSENYGIKTENNAVSPIIQGNNFVNNPTSIATYINSCSGISLNTNANILLLTNGSTSHNSVLQKQSTNSYFRLENSQITISQGTTLEIKPGIEIRSMHYGDNFTIHGTLTAKGTSTDSIKFIGIANLNVSNSSHGGSLRFEATSVNSQLEYVSIDKWGDFHYNGDYGAIYINSAGVSISKSIIKNSENTGIVIGANGISPVIQNNNFINNYYSIATNISSTSGITLNRNAGILLLGGSTNTDGALHKQADNSYFMLENSRITISQGDTIEIKPGVEIRSMHYNDYISVYGTLIAKGTATDSVRFRGFANINYSNSSHGGILRFEAGSINSQLEYVSMDKWGDMHYNGDFGAILINSSGVSISKSMIRNSENTGILIGANGISPIIQDNNFANNYYSIATNIGSTSGIALNRNASIYLFGSSTNKDGTLFKQGVNSYFKLENSQITISQGDTIEIKPGVEIRSTYYTDNISVYGTLIAKGTAADSIRFRGFPSSYNSPSTHGGSLRFESTSVNSQLEYVSMDRWGDIHYNGNYGAIYINTSNVSINKSTIRNSEDTGIIIASSNAIPTIQNNKFANNLYAISAYADNCGGILSNTNALILLNASNISRNATIPFAGPNSYYLLNGKVSVPNTYTLTIESGNLIDFGVNSGELDIEGTLRAIGTELSPIQFISAQVSNYGGRVYLRSGSTNSILSYVLFDKLGGLYNGFSALDIGTNNFSISNITISNSSNIGLQYFGGSSSIISASNFFNNKTGVYAANGKLKLNNCNIYGNTDYGVNNVSPSDTVDARNSYWGDTTGPYHLGLNPTGKGNQVSDRVLFMPIKQQPLNGQITDIGVSAILAPFTDCNLTSTTEVKVRISNYGNSSAGNFQVSYRVNTGTIVTENVTGASLLPGRTYDHTFTTKANLQSTGTYLITAFTRLTLDSLKTNDTLRTTIQHLPSLGTPGSLIPSNNASGLDKPVTFSWSAIANVTGYDLYYWKTSESMPATPKVSGLTQINYTTPYGTLEYGTQYSWKVVAKRVSCQAETAVQRFTTRQLPNLKVDNIIAPASAVSENTISVQYIIKNYGAGGTGSTTWYDAVYLCDQPVLYSGEDNFYLGSIQNFSALNPNQPYTSQSINFKIPQGKFGTYYVIVTTNAGNFLQETDYTDNSRVSAVINVTLAPPPDLQVLSPVVASPQNVFSEDTLTISYTVKNLGTGPTTATHWEDYIFLTKDEVLNPNTAIVLGSQSRTQSLANNASYSVTKKLKLPARISGTYYVHIFADRWNSAYEFNKEDNNITASLPVNVTQKPTPDLTVGNVIVSLDSVSNNQPFTVQWTTTNEGVASANPTWRESIYYNNSTVFSGATIWGDITQNLTINSLNSISGQFSANIPANLPEGNYYFFVQTDPYNEVYENPDVAANTSPASGIVRVVNADLLPVSGSFNAPSAAQSEQTIAVQWRVRNNSRAVIMNSSWTDKVYLSTNNTLEPGTDIQVGSIASSQLLGKGAEYSRQISIKIPEATPTGNYYLLIVTDAENTVFEKNETNNLITRQISITLAPWADLQVSTVSAPAADTIGTSINIQYTVSNSGSGNIVNKKWTDAAYLSPSNNPAETNLVLLGTLSQDRTLNAAQTYTQSGSFIIPSIAAGQYYVLVKTDTENSVFENTQENNNTRFTAATTNIRLVVVAPPVPIDISVSTGKVLSTTVTAGQAANIEWTVKNNSASATVVSGWRDAVYLNNSPIINQNATLLATVNINGTLAAGATYTRTASVNIPQTASGTLYIIVSTDIDNLNNDPLRGNNTLALNNGSGGSGVVITTPPPADLIPLSFTASAQGVVAQPVNVNFQIKNQGTGPTPSEAWTDGIYLSTDIQLDGSDMLLGTFSRNGSLLANGTYTLSDKVFLPSTIAGGNYVLILKTDIYDNAFERNNENNNTAFTNIFINGQQPSDLLISTISVPATEQFAGSNTTISWDIINTGSNNANGFKRDAVYFSKDTLFDASDVLFGILDKSIFLPSQASENNSLTSTLSNITVGEYYVIVRTDILNNIIEVNEDNNLTRAVNKLKVQIKELPIGTLKRDTLKRDIPLYYRIEVPQNLANETLHIDLKGDSSSNAANRLYISYSKTPSANEHEYQSVIPFKANQHIIIPELKAGTYYLTALGELPNQQLNQNVSLFAKIVPFSITGIEANQGGNTGLITVKISGAKFANTTNFKLQRGADVIIANKKYVIDQSSAFVTFNLAGKTVGDYHVIATQANNETATLTNGFKIVEGPAGGFNGNGSGFVCNISNIGFEDGLETNIVAPASARLNQVISFTVTYQNISSVDIPAQTRFLVSLNKDNPIGFTAKDLNDNKQDLILVCDEKNGPPGILRPGASGFFKVYAVSKNREIPSIDVTIIE